MTTARIEISLPADLLRLIDGECKARSISRNEFIRSALMDSFARAELHNMSHDYVREYEDRPETPDEVEAAFRGAADLLATEPWD